MNRLFDNFFGRPSTVPAAERTWVPLCDVNETKDDLFVTLEVPGVREKDIHVAIAGDVLTVKGERKWDKEVKDDSVHRVVVYSKFERAVPLPVPVQADKVKATYREGVLEIKLPKAEEVRPKEIKIDIL
ncbi:MAG: Hsp20/alpha crystallin family protein [Candidatus Rokuibacteriota bacterium]